MFRRQLAPHEVLLKVLERQRRSQFSAIGRLIPDEGDDRLSVIVTPKTEAHATCMVARPRLDPRRTHRRPERHQRKACQ